MLSKTIAYKVLSCDTDVNGRYIILNVEILSDNYSLLNMYAPKIKRPREHFFATLQEQIAEKSNGVKILGGDFNEVLTTTDRVTQSKYKRNKTLSGLVDLMKHLNLTDIWKLKNPEKCQFTWRCCENRLYIAVFLFKNLYSACHFASVIMCSQGKDPNCESVKTIDYIGC